MSEINFNYKKMHPFKWFILENFPFLEDSIDSLTNYQLFCKLGEEINKNRDAINSIGENAEELTNAINELYDWFNDLDVQEEINQKLDDLVTDGTLSSLIANYINPKIEEQNANIENFENNITSDLNTYKNNVNNQLEIFDTRLNASVSAPPIPVSSTSNMTDTTKIYINTTDGYWYYYDGSNWTQGGIYQSTTLGENSVHYPNLDIVLKTSFIPVNNPTSISTVNAGMVNANGTITNSTSLGYYEFSVNPFDVYKIHMRLSTQYSDSNVAIQYLNDTTVVSNILKSALDVGEDYYYTTIITIPYGVNKVRINTHQMTTTTAVENYILKVNKIEVNNINKNQLDTTLKTLFNNQYTEVTPSSFITGAFFNTNTVQAYTTIDMLSLEVNPFETYKISGIQPAGNPIIGFCTANKIIQKELNGNTYNINNMVSYIKNNTSNYEYDNYEFTIPEYCNKIYINHYSNDTTLKVEKCTSYKINESDVINNVNNIGFSKLYAVGDSLTELNYRALKNYLSFIKDDMPSLTVENLGASGTGFYNGGTLGNNNFASRVNSIDSYTLATDIVTVFGSVNDIGDVSDHLGELGDTTNDTIYGSIYNFFNTLFNSFNGVRVGCISPLNWKNSNTNTSVPLYLNALKETCELFNVPYLDLYHESNLRPNNSTFLNEYYTSDGAGHDATLDSAGIHPNSKGHRLIYGRIKDFINRL